MGAESDLKTAVTPFGELLMRFTSEMYSQVTWSQLLKEWALIQENPNLQFAGTCREIFSALLESMQETCISDGSDEDVNVKAEEKAAQGYSSLTSARHDSVLSCESEYLEDEEGEEGASHSSSPTSPTAAARPDFSPDRVPKKSSLVKNSHTPSTLFASLSNSSSSSNPDPTLFSSQTYDETKPIEVSGATSCMSRSNSLICSGSGSSDKWDCDLTATPAELEVKPMELGEPASPTNTETLTTKGSMSGSTGSIMAAMDTPPLPSPTGVPVVKRNKIRRVSFIAAVKEDRSRKPAFPSTPLGSAPREEDTTDTAPASSPTRVNAMEGAGLSLLNQASFPTGGSSFAGGGLLDHLAMTNKADRETAADTQNDRDRDNSTPLDEATTTTTTVDHSSSPTGRPPKPAPLPISRDHNTSLYKMAGRSNSVASSAGFSDLNDDDSDEALNHTVTETKEVRKETDELGNKYINNYAVVQEIGRGSFGKVKKVQHIETGRTYAIKVLNKSLLRRKSASALLYARQEVAILKKLRHRNIVSLYEVIDDEESNKMYMVLEYAGGGVALHFDDDGLVRGEGLDMETSRKYFRDLVSALKYSHANNIIHRDIKPENLLLDDEGNLMLADFGVSAMVDEDDWTLHDLEGTPAFQPPEALDPAKAKQGVDGKKLDLWALGVTLYTFVYGRLPFFGETRLQMVQSILSDEPGFSEISSSGELVDEECVQVMQELLHKDPAERIEMVELMSNLWVSPPFDPTEVPLTPLHHSGRTTGCVTPGCSFNEFGSPSTSDSFSIGSPTIATSPNSSERRFNKNGANSDTPPTPTKGTTGRRARSKSVVQVTMEEVENSILKGRRINLLEKVAMTRRMSFKGIGIGLRNQSFTLVPEIYAKGVNIVALSASILCVTIVERIAALQSYSVETTKMLRVTIDSGVQTDPGTQGLSVSCSSLVGEDQENPFFSNTSFSKRPEEVTNSPQEDLDRSWSSPLASSVRFNSTTSGPLERAGSNPATTMGSMGSVQGTPKSPSLSKKSVKIPEMTEDNRDDFLSMSQSPSRLSGLLQMMASPKRQRTKTMIQAPASPTAKRNFMMPASPKSLLDTPGSPTAKGPTVASGAPSPPSYAEANGLSSLGAPSVPTGDATGPPKPGSPLPSDAPPIGLGHRRKRAQTMKSQTPSPFSQ